jgi:undecaprenyldiphospho-muramoylpentapeptide beta-N-acetylglucosaminyltransferase
VIGAGPRRWAIIAGGGTAGHLQPALAIAEALVEAGHGRDTIEFVGSRRGQDRVVLATRGFPFTLLPGRGVRRSLAPDALAQNLVALAHLAGAAVVGTVLVARRRPAVVVSVGGYASIPAAVAAVVLRVPLVLVNVDAVPGAANRLFGRFARASAVGWEGAALPRAVVTGTPVRPEIAGVGRGAEARRAARIELGLPADRPTVVVFGGSLGARRLNEAIDGVVHLWGDRCDRSVYHIVGRRDWAGRARPAGTGAHGPTVVAVPYEERMAVAYAAADLVVSRAGAMTVAELALAGVPAVLVPLPGAPGDHQTANARALAAAGAAVVLEDGSCDAARLATTIDELLGDTARLAEMARAARKAARPDAARAAAALVSASARAQHRPEEAG